MAIQTKQDQDAQAATEKSVVEQIGDYSLAGIADIIMAVVIKLVLVYGALIFSHVVLNGCAELLLAITNKLGWGLTTDNNK